MKGQTIEQPKVAHSYPVYAKKPKRRDYHPMGAGTLEREITYLEGLDRGALCATGRVKKGEAIS